MQVEVAGWIISLSLFFIHAASPEVSIPPCLPVLHDQLSRFSLPEDACVCVCVRLRENQLMLHWYRMGMTYLCNLSRAYTAPRTEICIWQEPCFTAFPPLFCVRAVTFRIFERLAFCHAAWWWTNQANKHQRPSCGTSALDSSWRKFRVGPWSLVNLASWQIEASRTTAAMYPKLALCILSFQRFNILYNYQHVA